MSDVAALNVKMTPKLRERARAMAKILRTSTTAIIVGALTREVEAFEEKQREEINRLKREREERIHQRRRPVLIESPSPMTEPASLPDDDIDVLYHQHAKRIAEIVDGDIRELRLRQDEALTAIRRQFPLTSPPESEINAKLERLVRRYPKQPSPASNKPDDGDEKIIIIKESP